jgi:hypothetical protein
LQLFKLQNWDDYQKYEAVFRETVDASLLWREISLNLGAFTVQAKFDGGFTILPLMAANPREADFLVNGVGRVASVLRDIRNALSHGRDKRSTGVIAPTSRNFRRLGPWVSLVGVAAGEVILYHNVDS